jgi:truncated hemoglobin YjbI
MRAALSRFSAAPPGAIVTLRSTEYPLPTENYSYMNRTTLKLLALATGLGTLTACPADSGTTSTTAADSTGASTADTSGSTVDPTNSTPPTTSDPTTSSSTTSTDPTATDTGTTDPGTSSSTTDPGTSSTTGGPVSTLCERLGGMADDGIPALVNGFLSQVLVDEKINGYFLNSDVDGGALGACVVDQLGALAECPGVEYKCQSMKDAHAGLKISQQDFDDFVVDFVAAYDTHAAAHPDLTPDDKTTIGGALGGMAVDIVEDPTNDLTVYQRVGRKPAIKGLIGQPGATDSFVDNVAINPAINGFFGATDFERLNTCLTRQVSSIDGPIKYGAEVDAPPGTDPGVAAANPCRDMKTSHAGMMDDMMSGITIDDFMALVGDLVTAMTTAGVPDADQMAILGVLGPMCDDIVADPNTCPGNSQTELVEAVGINIDFGGNGNMWDDKYNGMISSMLCTDIVFADSPLPLVGGMSLKVGLDHSFVGDLTIKIVSPDNKIFTPLSRPGPEAALKDDGVPCCGDDTNVSSLFPFGFANNGLVSGKDMGKAPLITSQTVCKDENPKIDPCVFKPFPGLAPGKDFNDFKGANVAGNWKVCIGDSGKLDGGKLQYIGLTIDRVKYPPK